jgi:hypothetical protein
MNWIRCLGVAAIVAIISGTTVLGQEPPKPGPELATLKKLEGAWEATMKIAGAESKGTMIYKMELGGLWLTSSFEGEFGGTKFMGKGLDSYDPAKKKFVGIWVDSMSTSPMFMEGTFDKDKKEMTMAGEGPGMDGKPAKYKTITRFKDDDNVVFDMYMGDSKEPTFTIMYKRKK